jgi:Ca-activated chloride channel homolog
MNQALHQFHFLQPWWLLGLLGLPIALWLGLRSDPAQRALSRLVDPELLPHLVTGQARRTRWPAGWFAMGWLLGVLALSGPTWSRVAEPLYKDHAAQVVALSLSQHMLTKDVPPNRLQRARYKAQDLFAANRDGLNALIAYAGQSFTVAPLTSDAHSLDQLLEALSPNTMPVQGDNAAQAIELGAKLMRDAQLNGGSLVLITDNANADAQAAARKALASGVHVSVLGVGTPQGAPVVQADGTFLHDDQGNMVVARRNDVDLTALAQAGGGTYVSMTENGSDVAALHAELQPSQRSTVSEDERADTWQDRGPWLLLPLMLIVALTFRRGWVLLLPLALLPMWPTSARASDWQDWWRRPDQQAAQALQRGDAAKAQQLAKDPALRGAAAYRAKDYAGAVQALEHAQGADAQYNLGNALAKLGRYPEALKAYDAAVRLDPGNSDARANRAAVQEAMRKQAMQQPPQNASSQASQQSGNGQGSQNQQGGQNGHSGQPSGQGQSQQAQAQQGQAQQGQTQQSQTQQSQTQQSQTQQSQTQQSKTQQDGTADAKEASAQAQAGQKAGVQNQVGTDQNGHSPNTSAQSPDASQPGQNKQGTQDASAHAESAEERTRTQAAQQALQAQMDRALAQSSPGSTKTSPVYELGKVDHNDPLSKLPVEVRHQLDGVQDDPGAFLRAKFAHEYEERTRSQWGDGEQP